MSFEKIETIGALETLYGTPGEASIVKVADKLTPEYHALIEASPFFALATVGPEGLDCSPRGEQGRAFVIHDEKTIIIPDRRGNNRLDSLRNIVRNPEVALLFLIPGSNTTVRLNGTAIVTADITLLEKLGRDGMAARSAIVVTMREVYFQCGRAIMRAGLWNSENHVDPKAIPQPGQILQAQLDEPFDGEKYDSDWPERAAKSLW